MNINDKGFNGEIVARYRFAFIILKEPNNVIIPLNARVKLTNKRNKYVGVWADFIDDVYGIN